MRVKFRHEGLTLHAAIKGQGGAPPVVFLHGLSSSAETFAWLPEEITVGRRVIRLDFRGHGASDPAPGSYGLSKYASDAVALLREEVGRPAVLVGHSLGAGVAWWVAQRHPELVRAAFLEDPPLYRSEPDELAMNARASVFVELRDAALSWQEEAATPAEVVAALSVELAQPAGPALRSDH
jgi:esterase